MTVLAVERKDVPATATYVAQTQSSQAVNIQARVSGFLDQRVYVEGSVVKGKVVGRWSSLVKPSRHIVGAQLHGLTDKDVAKAPAYGNRLVAGARVPNFLAR